MRGDIDNSEHVSLDGSPTAIRRVVRSVRSVPEQRLQFGTVKVDYGRVAVWRPFDPTDTSFKAPWRAVAWRNVYHVRVPHNPIPGQPGYVTYDLDVIEIDGSKATLPVAHLALGYHLKEHLALLGAAVRE
jgi:hypothetical protein